MSNEIKNIEIPEFCPSCDSELEEVNEQLFCRNPDCQAQFISAITHFCKVLKIKGLGEKTIEKLNISSIADIYHFSQETLEVVLGSKIGAKIAFEIEKSKSSDLVTLLQAFNIPSIGEVASKKICGVVSHISEITEETCKKAGLGQVSTTKLLNWLSVNLEEVLTLPFSFKTTMPKGTKSLGVTVCITGKLDNYKNREEASTFLTSKGFTVVDSVGVRTNVLIDEEGRKSSKIDKAQSLNIPILTIQQLLERYKI